MLLAIVVVYSLFFTGIHSYTKTDDAGIIESILLRFENEKQDMQKQINALTEKVHNLENCNYERGNELDKRLLIGGTSEPDNSARVAFFANKLTVNRNLSVHQALIFGGVVTNVGNNYHKETGMFVCTVPGYYVFSVNVLIAPGHEIRTTLVQNGSVKQQFYSGDSTNHSNGGATVVLHVNAGDLVWVRLESTDGAHTIDWESNFTGFLLYKD